MVLAMADIPNWSLTKINGDGIRVSSTSDPATDVPITTPVFKPLSPDKVQRIITESQFKPGEVIQTESGEKKELYEPFKVIEGVDPDVQAIQRDTEEKLYLILYYCLEDEEYRFEKFYGRYDAYFGLQRILESCSVDLDESKVLVEAVGKSKTGKPIRYMVHPDDALTVRQFHAQMEPYFGDNAWSIEEFETASLKAEENKEFFPSALTQNVNFGKPIINKAKFNLAPPPVDDAELEKRNEIIQLYAKARDDDHPIDTDPMKYFPGMGNLPSQDI